MAAASLEGRLLKNVAWILCLCGLLALPLAAGAAAPTSTPSNNGRVLYKWVDKDGVTHYGAHVPPAAASQDNTILSASRCSRTRSRSPTSFSRPSTAA